MSAVGASSESVRLVGPAQQRAGVAIGEPGALLAPPGRDGLADLGLDRVAARSIRKTSCREPVRVDARDAELETGE